MPRKKLVFFAAILFVIGSVWGGWAWSIRCPDNSYSSLENFNSDEMGTQEALRQISQQIERCPKASLYVAHYDISAKGRKIDDVSIKFEPATGILVYEPDYSAEIQLWRKVDVKAVQEIARNLGKLSSLEQFGCYKTR